MDNECSAPNGIRVWAGRAGDPFWIDADLLHAVGHAFEEGTMVDPGSWTSKTAKNLFAGQTVYSIVLEVPDVDLLARTGESGRSDGWRSLKRRFSRWASG